MVVRFGFFSWSVSPGRCLYRFLGRHFFRALRIIPPKKNERATLLLSQCLLLKAGLLRRIFVLISQIRAFLWCFNQKTRDLHKASVAFCSADTVELNIYRESFVNVPKIFGLIRSCIAKNKTPTNRSAAKMIEGLFALWASPSAHQSSCFALDPPTQS